MDLPPSQRGALVIEVLEDSPAERAGQEIALTVLRDEEEHRIEVTLGERPQILIAAGMTMIHRKSGGDRGGDYQVPHQIRATPHPTG